MHRVIKILSINVAVFVVLSLLVILTLSLISAFAPSGRADLPNYKDTEWATAYFQESKNLRIEYKSFVGWRRKAYQGKTITIDEFGFRRTLGGGETARSVYFFGGSTMWGTGVNDENTIPTLFASKTGLSARNYGETAWTAHQSLNQLIKLYTEGHRPHLVVFYDGVNEVDHKCRHELNYFSTSREAQIRHAMRYSTRTSRGSYYYRPFVDIYDAFIDGISDRPYRNCHINKKKARRISKALLEDWRTAKLLVESYCGQFIAILQPNAFVGSPKLDHLPDIISDSNRRLQYDTVYPLIQSAMRAQGIGYDLTDSFDKDEFIYIDFSHVSPNGNAIIADRIISVTKTLPAAEKQKNRGCNPQQS